LDSADISWRRSFCASCAMAQPASRQVLHGGRCCIGCGCQSWHPPELDDGLREDECLAKRYICEGCEHHLSFHECGVNVCGKKLMKKDAVGNSVFDSDGQEVVLGTCQCTRFIPDPSSKSQKLCHGCSHHTSFHLAQMAPVAARRVSGKSTPSSGLFGESQSQVFPPSVDVPLNQGPTNSSTPKSTTPLSGPVGKKQRTGDDELAAPNQDWVASFTGNNNVLISCMVCLLVFV
jgi:hypothetical protein